jgi:hypothetical protein
MAGHELAACSTLTRMTFVNARMRYRTRSSQFGRAVAVSLAIACSAVLGLSTQTVAATAKYGNPDTPCRMIAESSSMCSNQLRAAGRSDTQVRLTINKHAFGAGETVYFWVQNIGTSDIGLIGEAFTIQRNKAGVWIKDPLTPDGFRRVRWGNLSPGEKGPRQHFALPNGIPFGRYRISKEVLVGKCSKPKQLTVEFRLVP